jgi:hypothetical protein
MTNHHTALLAAMAALLVTAACTPDEEPQPHRATRHAATPDTLHLPADTLQLRADTAWADTLAASYDTLAADPRTARPGADAALAAAPRHLQ